MIVSFSHNDLDALGCELCIKEKFKTDIIYFNTNYRDLSEQTQRILNHCQFEKPDLIIVSDICFNNNKEELLKLSKISRILYIDHHEYSEDFFDDLPETIRIVYDKNKSAAKLTAETLKSSDYLQRLTSVIQAFDIWQENSEYFKAGFGLNMYFWSKKPDLSIQGLHDNFYPRLNPDITKDVKEFYQEADKYLESKKDFIKTHNNITFAIIDEYFMNLTQFLFKYDKSRVVFILTTYGKVLVRLSSRLDDSICREIKSCILNYNNEDITKGHLRAFSLSYNFNNLSDVQKFSTEVYNKIISIEGIK